MQRPYKLLVLAIKTFTVDAPAASRRVALEAFRTAMSFRFFLIAGLTQNMKIYIICRG
jgi:hypothetical protein